MDNLLQIEEIKKYRRFLADMTGEEIDENAAACHWISNYAKSWRMRHSSNTQACDAERIRRI
jgi:hypothetical protein